jgi:hypothetical protein
MAALVPFEALQTIFDPDFRGSGLKEVGKAAVVRLIIVGLIQVELTAYFGVKVFADPVFGSDLATNCTESTKFHVPWVTILATNSSFQAIFTRIYTIALLPTLSGFCLYGLNLMQGALWLCLPYPYGRLTIIMFPPLLWICVIIASTEATIRINIVSSGENVWSFGQTFALLILVFPIKDILVEIMAWVWDEDERQHGERRSVRETETNVLVTSRPVRSRLRLQYR